MSLRSTAYCSAHVSPGDLFSGEAALGQNPILPMKGFLRPELNALRLKMYLRRRGARCERFVGEWVQPGVFVLGGRRGIEHASVGTECFRKASQIHFDRHRHARKVPEHEAVVIVAVIVSKEAVDSIV